MMALLGVAQLICGLLPVAVALVGEWDEVELYGPGPTALPNLEGTWRAGATGELFALRSDKQRPVNTTYLRECAGGAECGSCRQQAVHDYDARELQGIRIDCGAAGTGTVQSETSVVMADGEQWVRRDTAVPQKFVEVAHAAIGCASPSSCITDGGGCTSVPGQQGVAQCYWVGPDAAKAGCGSWAQCLGFWCGAQPSIAPGSNSSWCWARDSAHPLTGPSWQGATAYIKSSAEKIHTVHMVYMNHYDVGYTGFINDVDNTYMHDYFKLAAATARTMKNDTATTDRFIYTTHTWLMERFLNCPCPQKHTPQSSDQAGVYTDATGAWRLYLSEVDEHKTFKLQCLTTNWQGGSPGGCGWNSGRCTLSSGSATLSCELDNGKTIPTWPKAWQKFTGGLSGLWYGPSDTQDFYIQTHDAETNEVTVWWDTGISPAGWTYGSGKFVPATHTLTYSLTGYGALTGTVADDFDSITWSTAAGTWHAHPNQCYPGACHSDGVCAARSLENNETAPLQCPDVSAIADFEAAVKDGDIVWHGAPFNWQPENMCPQLFEAGIDLVRKMDHRFYGGTKNTTTMSVRDVIYVTRSVIPYMAKRGLPGLTIGSNPADFPPQVPKLHRWVDNNTGTDVIVAYHPYGYGGYGPTDCAESPNGFALCTEFRVDNTGPPKSPAEVQSSLDTVRKEYPGAKVITSTFDAFIADVMPAKMKLPVVSLEVGDSWMYGTPSDPLKMAENRALQRVWIKCLEADPTGPCGYNNPVIQNFTWALLKAPEHTWGTPGISGWGGGNDYDVKKFRPLLDTQPYRHASISWAEQRFFNTLALLTLEEANHPLTAAAREAIHELENVQPPTTTGMQSIPLNSTVITSSGASVGFGSDGSLINLQHAGVAWASADHPLGQFTYRTFNESDWKPFTYAYINGHGESGGFCKPGSNNFSEARVWRPAAVNLFVQGGAKAASSVIVELTMPPKASHEYGSWSTVFLSYSFRVSNTTTRSSGSSFAGNALEIDLTATLLSKLPTMVGESTSISFTPLPDLSPEISSSGDYKSAWSIDKLGQPVDPEGVLNGGNQFNHATWGGAVAQTAGGQFKLETLDAPNLNPITDRFPNGNPLPATTDEASARAGTGMARLAPGSVNGMAVNFHNNLWNTNYPLYYPYFDKRLCPTALECSNRNALFRLKLTLGGGK